MPAFWLMGLDLVSLKASVQCIGASMGAVCLWAAVVAFKVLGTHLFLQLLQSGPLSITVEPPAPYLTPGILAGVSVPVSALHCWPKLAR